jgi:phage tail sheath gpL-like
MGTNIVPEPTWVWAATNAAVASYYLNLDPARPLQTLVLPGLKPPAPSDRWDMFERNLLLFDGISTYSVNAAGQVQIEAQITNYQVNSYGAEDPSYLYVNTPATLGELRARTRAWVTQTFPRHKLRGNGRVRPGSAVVTPEIFRDAYLGGVAVPAENDGLIENAEALVQSMICEIDNNNPNRLNTLTTPDLVNQFRMYAERMQFRV